MKNRMVITIDGPSAAGKGSLARNLALYLDFAILDSGALYRAYAYFHNQGLSDIKIVEAINELVFIPTKDDTNILYQNNEITSDIRNEEIAKTASRLSALSETRELLIDIQRNFMEGKNIIADGRDMGTILFPEAKHKFFITASAEERARRRENQLKELGLSVNMRNLQERIEERDKKDSSREISPLIPAEDAVVIDSSNIGIYELKDKVLNLIRS